MKPALVDASSENLDRAAATLRGGGVVAFPTETVYGLGADAFAAAAVARIFEIKGRPAFDPLIVHVLDQSMLARVAADVPPASAGTPNPRPSQTSRGSGDRHRRTPYGRGAHADSSGRAMAARALRAPA